LTPKERDVSKVLITVLVKDRRIQLLRIYALHFTVLLGNLRHFCFATVLPNVMINTCHHRLAITHFSFKMVISQEPTITSLTIKPRAAVSSFMFVSYHFVPFLLLLPMEDVCLVLYLNPIITIQSRKNFHQREAAAGDGDEQEAVRNYPDNGRLKRSHLRRHMVEKPAQRCDEVCFRRFY
jgi:hypothetical protein